MGKTSLSTATAIALADAGQRVLLVSTDAASNLDEMLGVPLSNQPVPVPGVPGLSLLNIDPDTAAEAYRQRVLAQMEASASDGRTRHRARAALGRLHHRDRRLRRIRRAAGASEAQRQACATTTSSSTPRPPATPCAC